MAFDYEMKEVEVWDGNMAASQALRQAEIDVVAAYPITPSTPIVENYGNFEANGYIDGVFVMVESEHAAMSACIGASAAGGRVSTATSSQGYALMVETLYQASGMRLPIVLNVVNRALAAPLNVNGDHSDMYLGRDSGWIQLCAFNAQEAYDLALCAFRIGEDHAIRLPVMVHQDGFMTSHTAMGVRTIPDADAYKFVGDFQPFNAMLNFEKPASYGVQTEEDWHFEHKARQHNDLMTKVYPKVEDVFADFKKLTGREYNMVEGFDMEDAEIAVVVLGSAVQTARVVVKQLRAEGIKAGVIALRVFRPFPLEEIAKKFVGLKAIGAMDRSSPHGSMGALYSELAGTIIQMEDQPVLTNYIYGLGGRDISIAHFKEVFADLAANAKAGKRTTPIQQYVNVRGPKLSFLDIDMVK